MAGLTDHEAMLTALARRMVGEQHASDIVQETFLRALQAPPPDATRPMAPWLATVARHLAVDFLRKSGRVEPLADAEIADSPSEPDPVDFDALVAGLGALTPTEVVVLLLRDALDFTVDDASAALDSPPGSVRVLHHRARRKARDGDDVAAGLDAVDRFVTWLLARSVAGLPVTARPVDPGLGSGVIGMHLRLLDRMVAAAERSGRGDLVARARLSRGTALLVVDPLRAMPDLEAALAAGCEPTMAETRIAALHNRFGRHRLGLEVCERALARNDRPGFHGALHGLAAEAAVTLGDFATAERHRDAAAQLKDRRNAIVWSASVTARVALEAHRFDEAIGPLEVVLEQVRAAGHLLNETVCLNNLCFALLGLGRRAEARERGAEALTRARYLGERRLVGEVLGNLATLDLLDGDDAAAREGFLRALAELESVQQVRAMGLARTWLAVLDHLDGRPRDAAEALRPLVDEPLARLQLYAAERELGLDPTEPVDLPEGPLRFALDVHAGRVRPEDADSEAPVVRIAVRIVAPRLHSTGT